MFKYETDLIRNLALSELKDICLRYQLLSKAVLTSRNHLHLSVKDASPYSTSKVVQIYMGVIAV